MGQVTIITQQQKLLLDKFRQDKFLSSNFYFTGGTALSLHYLQHRTSVDLDFFSKKEFNPQIIVDTINTWQKELNLAADYLTVENTQIFNLTFPDKQTVKVDFAFYPHKQVEKVRMIDGIKVDSLIDIAINKLLTVEQRTEVKDFVDLYFLLQDISIWDLLEGVKVKFGVKIDPFIIGSDLLKVEGFDYLPEMIKPFSLEKLKLFFKQKAKQITGRSIKG